MSKDNWIKLLNGKSITQKEYDHINQQIENEHTYYLTWKQANNPDIFFKNRMNDIKLLHTLSSIEKEYGFIGQLPSQKWNQIKLHETEDINDFIQRYYELILNRQKEMHTNEGKLNLLKQFKNKLDQYQLCMTDNNIAYYSNLYKENDGL